MSRIVFYLRYMWAQFCIDRWDRKERNETWRRQMEARITLYGWMRENRNKSKYDYPKGRKGHD